MKWYKFPVAEYHEYISPKLADAEDLAYRRLMDLYYVSEGSLPGDARALAVAIRLDLDCVEPVLFKFFDYANGRYHHPEWDVDLKKRKHREVVNVQNRAMRVKKKLTEL